MAILYHIFPILSTMPHIWLASPSQNPPYLLMKITYDIINTNLKLQKKGQKNETTGTKLLQKI